MVTWEDLTELQQRFLQAPAWGQAGIQGRGSVTPATATSSPTLPPAQEGKAQETRRTRKPNKRYLGGGYI
jgi:hypothetical protein